MDAESADNNIWHNNSWLKSGIEVIHATSTDMGQRSRRSLAHKMLILYQVGGGIGLETQKVSGSKLQDSPQIFVSAISPGKILP